MFKFALISLVLASDEEKYQKMLEADRKIGRLLGKVDFSIY